MAQGDNIQISSHTANNQTVQNSSRFKAPKAKKSPTFQQLLQCDDSKWSQISSQVMKKNHGQEDEVNCHNKKSMLTKVKEKARKWKINLSRKKHSEKNESQCPVTRSFGVGPNDKREEDAEYHSARMYESKKTPATNTQSVASISGKHLEKHNTKDNKDEHESSSNTTEPHSKTHEPSDSSIAAATATAAADDTDSKNQTSTTMDVLKAHEFPETNSRFSGLKVSTSDNSHNKLNKSFEEGETTCKSESHTPDKGVWMKEYLLHKFEPGEDERALSKVITQAISPRRDKMREAMTSFLKNDDKNVSLNFKSKSLPAASTNLNTNNTPIKQSHSLGSSASKASMNLNQTFKSTFASYQDHFISSSSKYNTTFINSPTKTSSSPLGHGSSGNETKASAQDVVSHSVKKSQVPSHAANSVRRVPISRAKQTQDPSHSNETNTIQVRPSTGTDYNASSSNSSIGR